MIGINVERVMGKTIKVKFGKMRREGDLNIDDVNGNTINPLVRKIKFEKTLADLNLNEATTSFHISMEDTACSDINSGSYTEEIKSKIASSMILTA